MINIGFVAFLGNLGTSELIIILLLILGVVCFMAIIIATVLYLIIKSREHQNYNKQLLEELRKLNR